MMRILRPLCILAALAAFPADAAAQLEFAGIPWGSAPGPTADGIRSVGYRLVGTDQNGDLVFRGPGDELLVATLSREAGLVRVEVEWTGDPARLPGRYTWLADSLRGALGAPAARESGGMSWDRGEGSINLWLLRAQPQLDSAVVLIHTGPASRAEHLRRRDMLQVIADRRSRHGPADSAGLGAWAEAERAHRWRLLVDTAQVQALADGMYGVRLLDRWMDVRRLDNGLAYDSAIRTAEVDCRQPRLRVHGTLSLYQDVTARTSDGPPDQRQWVRPDPGSAAEASLRAVCQVLARQP
jgi:hypothetical protein